jgi:hypothetical protein
MAEMAVGNRPEFRRGHVDYAASRFALGQELSKDARVHYAPGQTVARDPLFSTSARRPSPVIREKSQFRAQMIRCH